MRGRGGGRKSERREVKKGRWREGETEGKMCPGFHINLYVP